MGILIEPPPTPIITDKKPIDDPENMEIIENDVSFNYATTQFEFQS